MKNILNKGLSLILFEIGFGLTFNVVGTISLSEIFLLIFLIVSTNKLSIYYSNKFFKEITDLYLFLLFAQVLSELVIANKIENSLKIWALSTMSFLHFFYLFNLFIKDKRLILFAISGMILKDLIFGSTIVEEASIDQVVAGEGAAFVKFYLARMIIYPVLILSVLLPKKKVMATVIIIAGLALVLAGARNDGLFFSLTGMIWFFLLNGVRLEKKKLISFGVIICSIVYGFYYVYVSGILDGTITAGNAWQIKKLDNPYNPFSLLIIGRANTFIGAIAFRDKFLFGHGAWVIDEAGKYWTMLDQLVENERDYKKIGLIPSHSVLIGAGVRNGLFAFISVFLLIKSSIKKGIRCLKVLDVYNVLIIYFILKLIWDGLFSPIAQLRLTFPLYFAFILTHFIHYNYKSIWLSREVNLKLRKHE